MRFRVLLEIDAPDVGTPTDNGGQVASPEEWIWQDFFDKNAKEKFLRERGVTVKEAIIIKPGHCGNCGEEVAFFDYLCSACREGSTKGTAQYGS